MLEVERLVMPKLNLLGIFRRGAPGKSPTHCHMAVPGGGKDGKTGPVTPLGYGCSVPTAISSRSIWAGSTVWWRQRGCEYLYGEMVSDFARWLVH
jgi:hypothetical protein